MIELPLTGGERDELVAALRASHRIRVGVDVLDRDERVVSTLSFPASRVLEGEVTVDSLADVTRSLRLSVLDPRRALSFDDSSPAATAMFADNMIAVRYGVWVEPLDRWVDVPVFWGPLTAFSRSGAQVTLEAMGKEALGLEPHFATQGYTIAKGRRVDDAIRDVMGRLGETRYSLPADMTARLPTARAVGPDDEPWDVVKFGWEGERVAVRGKGRRRRRSRVTVEFKGLVSLAGPLNAFYDGLGRLTARARSMNPVHAFREGVDLLNVPEVSYDALVACNHVVVTGAVVAVNGRQVQRRASATLPAEHPLSPASLARGGKPRYMTEFVTVSNLRTDEACRERAQRILEECSQAGLDAAFEALPMPMLEELDTVRVETSEYSVDVMLRNFTIPLTAAPMRAGWSK